MRVPSVVREYQSVHRCVSVCAGGSFADGAGRWNLAVFHMCMERKVEFLSVIICLCEWQSRFFGKPEGVCLYYDTLDYRCLCVVSVF